MGLPVLLLIYVVGMVDTGSPLFKQERVGRNQKPFTLVKFRTMRVGTASVASHLADTNAITPMGQFLRRTKLDELPQLWNVLLGDMSLVGPRPALIREVDEYTNYDKQRLLVTPGISGLWQVSGRSRLTFAQMVELDLEYVTTRSYWMDIKILFKTIKVVCTGDGAY